jgi:hypothetical protein
VSLLLIFFPWNFTHVSKNRWGTLLKRKYFYFSNMKKTIKHYPMTGRLIVTWGYIYSIIHMVHSCIIDTISFDFLIFLILIIIIFQKLFSILTCSIIISTQSYSPISFSLHKIFNVYSVVSLTVMKLLQHPWKTSNQNFISNKYMAGLYINIFFNLSLRTTN